MVFQHRFSGTLPGGDSWMFTWWATSGQAIDTVHNAGVAWASDFFGAAPVAALFPIATTLTNVTTVQVTDATGKQTFRRDGALALAGSNASGALPGDVALVTSLRTALSNRSGRGRFYLPGPAKDQVASADGRVEATAVTALLGNLSTAWTNYVATAAPVIYSRTLRSTTPVTSFDIGNLFDTQRRRESSMLESRVSNPMP